MSNFEKLQGRLAAGETILMDGGMGSEFERRGLVSPTTWSGGPMLTHPELVRDIHQEYIEAGAEIIITNTFGTGRDSLTTLAPWTLVHKSRGTRIRGTPKRLEPCTTAGRWW